MAKKETKKPGGFDFDVRNSRATQMAEQEIAEGKKEVEQGRGLQPPRMDSNSSSSDYDTETVTRSRRKDTEPTKGVQAQIPMSLYRRLKKRQYETDETLQSMYHQALVYWLDAMEKS